MPRRQGDDLEAIVVLAQEDDPRYMHAVVGCNIRARRKAMGWTQDRLARVMTERGWRLTQKQVSALESNSHYGGVKRRCRVSVDVDRLVLLADVLLTDIGWLLDDRWQKRVRAAVAARDPKNALVPVGAVDMAALDAASAALTS